MNTMHKTLLEPPFYITSKQDAELRKLATELVPSPLIFKSKNFDDFVSQLMIPNTGIIYCLIGKLDVMLYDRLDWDSNKLGLLTLNEGDCAWLNEQHFPVHKVYSPMLKGSFIN